MKYIVKCFLAGCAMGVLLMLTGVVHAAPLAVVCDNLTNPADLKTCTGGHYKAQPAATDIVRKGTTWDNFVPTAYGALAPTDNMDACEDPATADGAAYAWPFNSATDPCKDWGIYPASTWSAAAPPAGTAAVLRISWTLPTQATDNTPLTGAQVLTAVQLFVSSSPIADDSTMAPTATFTGDMVQATYNGTVAVGTTLYARVKVVNASGVSDFSAQASKLIEGSRPGVATDVQILLTITP